MLNIIEEWGKWARHHKDDLGSQSAWLSVMRDNVQMHKGVRYCITDEQALVVDKAVGKLAKHNLVLLNILCYRHLADWSIRRIAREYLTVLEYGSMDSKKQVRKEEARALLDRAEGYVLGAMNV